MREEAEEEVKVKQMHVYYLYGLAFFCLCRSLSIVIPHMGLFFALHNVCMIPMQFAVRQRQLTILE